MAPKEPDSVTVAGVRTSPLQAEIDRGEVIGTRRTRIHALLDEHLGLRVIDELTARACLQVAADYYARTARSLNAASMRMTHDAASELNALVHESYRASNND